MEDPVELQRLLSRVALGDRKAFRALYDATSPSLFGVAVRILNRRDRAEEVIQDVSVNVWQRAASYSNALSAPMTWLTAIVRNRALDVLRSESARATESSSVGQFARVPYAADYYFLAATAPSASPYAATMRGFDARGSAY